MMVQMVVKLIQHHPIVVLFDRFGLRADIVILSQKVAAEPTKPT